MATDSFSQNDSAILAPYTRAVEVTPDDEADLAEVARALNVHGSGSHHDVAVILSGDSAPVVLKVANGDIVPIRVRRVMSTDTTATSVVALY